MGHIPDNDSYDEFMNAFADEWSKPEEPSPEHPPTEEKHDRWGSPIPEQGSDASPSSRNSKSFRTPESGQSVHPKKKGKKGWIIAVIVIIVVGVCACLALAGLELFQVINIF